MKCVWKLCLQLYMSSLKGICMPFIFSFPLSTGCSLGASKPTLILQKRGTALELIMEEKKEPRCLKTLRSLSIHPSWNIHLFLDWEKTICLPD